MHSETVSRQSEQARDSGLTQSATPKRGREKRGGEELNCSSSSTAVMTAGETLPRHLLLPPIGSVFLCVRS